MAANDIVRARIDPDLKREATAVLSGMGLSVSDAIRLTLVRITEDRALPFQPRTPNRKTEEGLQAAQQGEGARFASVDALFDDLNDDEND